MVLSSPTAPSIDTLILGNQVYFIEAGTYIEQVVISRANLRIYGATVVPGSYSGNSQCHLPSVSHWHLEADKAPNYDRPHSIAAVTFTNNVPASVAGSNDASGTVQVHATNVSLYNLNIANTYGHPVSRMLGTFAKKGSNVRAISRSTNLRQLLSASKLASLVDMGSSYPDPSTSFDTRLYSRDISCLL